MVKYLTIITKQEKDIVLGQNSNTLCNENKNLTNYKHTQYLRLLTLTKTQ